MVLALMTPYRGGTTHIVLSPLEFMRRLTALVLRPRLNLILFMACLHQTRSFVLRLFLAARKTKVIYPAQNDAVPHSSASVRISWARLLKRVFEIDIELCPHCGGNMKIIAAIL